MSQLRCPICKKPLQLEHRTYRCLNHHSFDQAKQGYVNLLLAKKLGEHGDDQLMVRARKEFLKQGYYQPLRGALEEVVSRYAHPQMNILDAGCGECWYTAYLEDSLLQNGYRPNMIGVDISKRALAAGGRRMVQTELAVSSVFQLPVADHWCQLLLSVFAPYAKDEFWRVLQPEGLFIRVVPLERHLWSLKKAIYEAPYLNEPEEFALEGYEIEEVQEIRERIYLENQRDIQNLFMMTPYYYRTSQQDREKLAAFQQLETETEFAIAVYRKQNSKSEKRRK